MVMNELPETLTFYQNNVKEYDFEYSWAIELDTDMDGLMDFKLTLWNYKDPNAGQMKAGILDVAVTKLSKLYKDDTAYGPESIFFPVIAEVNDNTIILSLDRRIHPAFDLLEQGMNISCQTSYNNGVSIFSDYLQ